MKAFHGDPKVKEKYLARVKAHRKADQIVQRHYWEDGKGCAVGCTIHGSDHQAYETELGIPIELAHLQDWIFENLPNGEARDFPVDFLESIPAGADLKLVLPQFLHWLLVDPEDGVIGCVQDEEQVAGSPPAATTPSLSPASYLTLSVDLERLSVPGSLLWHRGVQPGPGKETPWCLKWWRGSDGP